MFNIAHIAWLHGREPNLTLSITDHDAATVEHFPLHGGFHRVSLPYHSLRDDGEESCISRIS
jgi:hypothetical protein